MKVIKPNEVPEESADSPLFTGGRVPDGGGHAVTARHDPTVIV